MDQKVLEELRKKRLEKKISLQEIASFTRINVRFLEAIENGEFEILPKPYIKAFLKQYAVFIGYDEKKAVQLFEEYKKEPEPVQKTARKKTGPVKPPASPDSVYNPPKLKRVFLSIAAAGGLALVVYLFVTTFDFSEEQVVERPFLDVVREIEEHADQISIEPFDSLSVRRVESRDSVTLAVTALDTVWLTITVDNVLQEEYIFPPGRSSRWIAANEFLMTVGNAGGVSITVNDDSIGVLGDAGQVVRNLQITRDGIQR